MYNVDNTYYYKIWDARYQEFVDYLYSDKELINYIAKRYSISYFTNPKEKAIFNKFIDNCACSPNDPGDKYFQIFDNYNRIINVKNFTKEAYEVWIKNGCEPYWESPWGNRAFRKNSRFRWKNDDYIFRRTPVPHTSGKGGGPWWKPPHTAGIKRMWANPDYKGFNRGTVHGIPDWWDDRTRCVQKSWKTQRKVRHQWQR